MEWGSTEVAHPHLNPATVTSLVSPKTGSPFITRKTATITVRVSPECHSQKNVQPSRNSSEGDTHYDSSPSQDTTTSNSSTAALLKKTAHELRQGHDPNVITKHAEEGSITEKNGEINYVDEHGTVANGKALLAKTLREVKRSLQDLSPVFSTESLAEAIKRDPVAQKKKTYIKNLIVMSLSCTLIMSPFSAIRSLQSSINHKAGLGLISMSSINVFFVLGCICAVIAVQRIRPKFAMLFTTIGQVLFIASNYYPSFYTVIPAAAILGFCFAVFWTAQGVYLTSIGFMYATLTGKTADSILSLFNGFYFVSIQLGQILGHLISSSIFNMVSFNKDSPQLFPLLPNSTINDESTNLTNWKHIPAGNDGICGINYCHSYNIEHPSLRLGHTVIYILLSVFLTMTFLSMLVNGIFLDKLDIIFHRSKGGLGKQMASIFRLHGHKKQLLFIWFTVYLGFEEAFFYGEMTKAFVTCPVGIHMVGYVMMCCGACGAITSVTSGRLVRYVGRPTMVALGCVIQASILVLMFFWTPASFDTVNIFIMVGAWSIADALLQTQALSLCGLLFPKQQEAAFASYRLYEAFGNMVAFGYAQFLCMQIKVYITGSVMAMAMFTYIGLEVYLRRQIRESETTGVGL